MPRAAPDHPALPWDPPPMARRSDADSSHQAADRHEQKGEAVANRRLCLQLVRAHGGLTSKAIAARTGLDRHEAARRLPELRDREDLVTNRDPVTGLEPRREEHSLDGYDGDIRWWAT